MPQSILWRGTQVLIEQPDSPAWTLADSVTARQIYRGPFALCLSSAPRRGVIGINQFAGMFVKQSTVQKERGGIGVLTIEWEGAGSGQAQVPQDEISIDNDEVERPLQKHPRYAGLTSTERQAVETLVQTPLDGNELEAAEGFLQTSPRRDLAFELVEKLRKQFTHFPTPAPTIRAVSYYLTPPGGLVSGIFRQSPPTLPFGVTPPSGVDWLRMADDMEFTGSYWRVTRTWKGGPDLDPQVWP